MKDLQNKNYNIVIYSILKYKNVDIILKKTVHSKFLLQVDQFTLKSKSKVLHMFLNCNKDFCSFISDGNLGKLMSYDQPLFVLRGKQDFCYYLEFLKNASSKRHDERPFKHLKTSTAHRLFL